MASTPHEPVDAAGLRQRLEPIWANPTGLGAVRVVNHTSVGLRFIVTGFIFS